MHTYIHTYMRSKCLSNDSVSKTPPISCILYILKSEQVTIPYHIHTMFVQKTVSCSYLRFPCPSEQPDHPWKKTLALSYPVRIHSSINKCFSRLKKKEETKKRILICLNFVGVHPTEVCYGAWLDVIMY